MFQILKNDWEVPWSVPMVVNSIRVLMDTISARVVHFLREGNTLAFYFTNLVFVFAGDFEFNNLEQNLVE